MGGFLFIKKDRRSGLEEIEDTYKKSIDVFKKKGLSLAGKIVRKDFILFHFHKYFGTEKSIYEFGHDDFILSIGTFIYKGKTGSGALNFFLKDFQKETISLDELCGQYAVIICINKNVYCFNDYLGLYRIYFDTSQKVFSNSFLAVSQSIKEKTLAVQELYEYLFYGAFFGGKTIFEEIRLMSSEYIWEIFPDSKASLKNLETSFGIEFKDEQSFSRIIADTQIAYFTMLRNIFKDNVTAGLSGGYDSRLMLALMRKVGVSPKLYVYGKDQSRDVKIAQSIAKGEHFDLVHINKHKYCRVPVHEFYELITNNYYCFDGLGNTGIFDNGSDIDTRIRRTRTCSIQLNGIGGEIYRNNGKLPNQAITVKSFIRAKYRLGDCSMGAHWLDKEDFYLNLEEKLVAALSIEEERLTRQQIEMHFPFFLYKYWTSINCSINNQFSQALTPFTEARFVYPSFRIPIKNKDYGAFHCLLIEHIDPNLMQYPFTKGFDFRTKMPIARNKNIDELLLKAYYSIKTYTTNKIESPERPIPYYLQENYLKEIFGPRNSLFINQFLSVERIKNPDVLSRALSLESVIQDTFS